MLTVATFNLDDDDFVDDIRNALHCEIWGAYASKESLERAIERYYPDVDPIDD